MSILISDKVDFKAKEKKGQEKALQNYKKGQLTKNR